MINKGVEAPNPDSKPKIDISWKIIPKFWLVDWNVVLGLLRIQEHVVLGEITFILASVSEVKDVSMPWSTDEKMTCYTGKSDKSLT